MFLPTRDYNHFRLLLQRGKRLENFTPHSDVEYDKCIVCIHHSWTAGFAVTKEGELINLFNHGFIKGLGAMAVCHAITMGAKKLDCFDGYLPTFYNKFGFIEVSRIKFDTNYAPDGWNYSELGAPDIVYMERS